MNTVIVITRTADGKQTVQIPDGEPSPSVIVDMLLRVLMSINQQEQKAEQAARQLASRVVLPPDPFRGRN